MRLITGWIVFIWPVMLWAQFSGTNLFEFQGGNLPYTDPKDLTTGYDQLNLTYKQKHVIGMVRFEQFQHQDQSLSYRRISQASIRYQKSGLDVRRFGRFSRGTLIS